MKKLFPILAIDYGERYTGLAWSPDGIMSFPLRVVDTKELTEQLAQILEKKKIKQLVVGLPTMDNGNPTPLTQTIQDIFNTDNFSLPVEFINERGSTKTAKQSTQNGRADDIAAQQILSYFLDKRS